MGKPRGEDAVQFVGRGLNGAFGLEDLRDPMFGPDAILASDEELANLGQVAAMDERTLLASVGTILREQVRGQFRGERQVRIARPGSYEGSALFVLDLLNQGGRRTASDRFLLKSIPSSM
jgi:hypothetical protein